MKTTAAKKPIVGLVGRTITVDFNAWQAMPTPAGMRPLTREEHLKLCLGNRAPLAKYDGQTGEIMRYNPAEETYTVCMANGLLVDFHAMDFTVQPPPPPTPDRTEQLLTDILEQLEVIAHKLS